MSNIVNSQTVQDVIAIIAFTGIVVWGLAGKSKKDTNDALVQETTSLRNQLGDSQNREKILEERAAKAKQNEETFKEIALGKPDFNKLSVQLTTQHKEILDSFRGLTEGISNLATTIAKDRSKNG